MTVPEIHPFAHIVPMIYAYITPGIPYHEGWTKIGYTDKQTVEDRINQQTHTANIRWKLAWQDNAIYKDSSGKTFTDHDFHAFLENVKHVEREKGTEWFKIDGSKSLADFMEFASRRPVAEHLEYTLRKEQDEAVTMTERYFKYENGRQFLWNAKPRFGKTLSAYDLIQRLRYRNVLVVTNRPSIANSWAEDFNKFIGWKNEYAFVTENDALRHTPGVFSYNEYRSQLPKMGEDRKAKGMIAFESLQGLKGSMYFGGDYDKLRWIRDTVFDLLIVDESQEGVDTFKTERAFKYIKKDHTLYLSGTPFKQLASDQFNDHEIYNWSYADEQEAKTLWAKEESNPYEALPKLNMFTYELSNMIYEKMGAQIDITKQYTVNYSFDLNEFFRTNDSGKFVMEDEVMKFIKALYTQEKYPYSTEELRNNLAHTLWILNRVDSVKALARLLKKDPVFSQYEIVIAAGDGSLDDERENEKSFDRVKKAIREHDKTITLSVGQLTVGVTIPEWSGVMMLCNLKSASSYMQAAFRAQNPCTLNKNGQRYRKENAYIFDFDPARTLIIFDEFANNLSRDTMAGRGTTKDREKKIRRLLNFFPVLGEDSEGRMVELDPKQVLSIPRKLKSQEVVQKGFMSNYLFQNITNIFGAPGVVKDIIDKLSPAKEEHKKKEKIDDYDDLHVNEEGKVDIPKEIVVGKAKSMLAEKVYETVKDFADSNIDQIKTDDQVATGNKDTLVSSIDQFVDSFKQQLDRQMIQPVMDQYDIKKHAKKIIHKDVTKEIDHTFENSKADFIDQTKIAKANYDFEKNSASNEVEAKKAEENYQTAIKKSTDTFVSKVKEDTDRIINNIPEKVVRKLETRVKEEKKESIETQIRDHLRGFSRTIPSFIMAYGDDKLTLANFDDYTEDDVFEEVTGITEENFRFLRDGGVYFNEQTQRNEYFHGHLFDEVVFNDSIKEFLRKKKELNNYFDESLTEDIFDYIPPQKTNQIYTPKKVVKKMVDLLEEENPGCFDDPNATFADLYMKSGMYITEIVKRLYKSPKMNELYPDSQDRLVHIFEKQVYGCAPTRIIYLIARNYILGFDEDGKNIKKHHLIQFDTLPAVQNGTLEQELKRRFDL